MVALHQNRTWGLVPFPLAKKIVGCEWVYTVKFNLNGSIDPWTTRLVTKRYTQTYGVDYKETFSPIAKISYVCVIISLAANLDQLLFQLGVENAFMHSDLLEVVYIEQAQGFVAQREYQSSVCKLQNAQYGLKQSMRA